LFEKKKTRGQMGLYRSPGFCHIFLYKTMTKGYYMSNINAFKPV